MTVAGQLCVAVLGLGEAGSLIAADLLAAGARVRAYDPAVPVPPSGATACTDEADAARGADVVLSVNTAADAEDATRAGLPGVATGALWADLNTAAPGLKRRLAELADDARVASWRRRSSRRSRPRGQPVARTGCAPTSPRSSPRPTTHTPTASRRARSPTPYGPGKEMAVEMLNELGAPARMSSASRDWHEQLARAPAPVRSPAGHVTATSLDPC